MRSRAEVMVASVRSCADPMCATVRNRAQPCKKTFLTGEPLRCWPRPMMVFSCTTPEGWGLFTAVHFLANKSCCTKRTQKQTHGIHTAERQACSTKWNILTAFMV